ncbi:hypothetical protein PCH_Pc20g00580 [Penicillium rubens Wisconsin 54-1255]|uniref:Uncharacterized protein n=1 Tax=Penicillium rubens (strain ATCC 28089 / DSM 1075 / NRRL 1951 / Wisconsin 54-1255) TaxID=500485 RepID=B6HG05_PENRW|nr:hypothetical protein PCH_Pc20g00580 [Penicillium rubens Wisconsin 54-1255]
MTPDDLVWEQAEEIFDKWLLQFLQHDVLRPIGAFIITHERGFGGKGGDGIDSRSKVDGDGHQGSIYRGIQMSTLTFHEQFESQEKAKVENSLEKRMDSEPTHDETSHLQQFPEQSLLVYKPRRHMQLKQMKIMRITVSQRPWIIQASRNP